MPQKSGEPACSLSVWYWFQNGLVHHFSNISIFRHELRRQRHTPEFHTILRAMAEVWDEEVVRASRTVSQTTNLSQQSTSNVVPSSLPQQHNHLEPFFTVLQNARICTSSSRVCMGLVQCKRCEYIHEDEWGHTPLARKVQQDGTPPQNSKRRGKRTKVSAKNKLQTPALSMNRSTKETEQVIRFQCSTLRSGI